MDELDHLIGGMLIAIISVAGVTYYKGVFDNAVAIGLGIGLIILQITIIYKLLDVQKETK